ncbi:uncharacterized protein LOC135689355 [Rhopilema esculentum]|uniref:uncharacterized protein LOC135689355 n=1 Tax=Rhopilema esculentum TaxID=499914 RepID=UPI0031E11BCC
MAFFCFRKKLPWSKTNHYNCNDAKDRNSAKTSRTGAADEDYGPYECVDAKKSNGLSPTFGNKNRLDKYGIDVTLDGSLRRSKKKKKKLHIMKPKLHEKQSKSPERKDERFRLASILDNATPDSPVQIITSLVDDYMPTTENSGFQVKVGDKVLALYRQGAFVFVKRFDGLSGFVPVQLCFLVGEYDSRYANEKLFPSESGLVANGAVMNPDNCPEHQNEPREPLKDITDSQLELEEHSKQKKLVTVTANEIGVELNDYECDSLARKVQKHEIRQLLKQETGLQISLSSNKELEGNIGLGSQTSLQKTNPLPPELENVSSEDSSQEAFDKKQETFDKKALTKDFSKGLILPQQPPVGPFVNGGSSSSRSNSKLSLIEKNGSQHSLNSHKSKLIRPAFSQEHAKIHPNGLRHNGNIESMMQMQMVPHISMHENSSQGTLNSIRAHFDNQSLSSYDGSIQDIFAKRNENSSKYGQNYPALGHFYENGKPSGSIESRIHELLRENQFIRNRRCSSLRKTGQHGGYGRDHSHGYGHGYSPALAADERSWRIYAESISAPGSRVMSPSEFGYQFSPTCNGSFEERSAFEDRFMFALRDFRSMEKDDVNLRKGERVLVLRSDSESWWWVRNSNGDEGFVPSQFLIPLLKPTKLDFGSTSDFSTKSSVSSYGEKRGSDEVDASKNRDMHPAKPTSYQERLTLIGNNSSSRLVRANTLGSETRGKRGVKVDWTKMYNTGNGHAELSKLKNLNGYKNGEEVESKEALLRKIRSEVQRDPMSPLVANGRARSNENINRVNVRSLDMNKALNVSNHKRVTENGPALKSRVPQEVSQSYERKSNAVKPVDVDRKCKAKPDLPSYEQCVDQIKREEFLEGQLSGSNGDVTQDSALFSTPRVLRRRRTYSGTLNNKKVRFNQMADDQTDDQVQDDGHPEVDNPKNTANQNGAQTLGDEVDPNLSTWC